MASTERFQNLIREQEHVEPVFQERNRLIREWYESLKETGHQVLVVQEAPDEEVEFDEDESLSV